MTGGRLLSAFILVLPRKYLGSVLSFPLGEQWRSVTLLLDNLSDCWMAYESQYTVSGKLLLPSQPADSQVQPRRGVEEVGDGVVGEEVGLVDGDGAGVTVTVTVAGCFSHSFS